MRSEAVRSVGWWLSGLSALALHGLVAWAMPSGAPLTAQATHSTLQLSWITVADSTAPTGDAVSAGPVATIRPNRGRRSAPPQALNARALGHVPFADSDTAAFEPSAAAPGDASANAGAAGESGAGGAGAAGAGVASGAGVTGSGAGALRGPGLLAVADPCFGFFPATAAADEGQVHIDVRVDADGRAQASDLLVERPAGQGFGQAARACARALRFSPAVNERGAPVAGHAKLALRFRRG